MRGMMRAMLVVFWCPVRVRSCLVSVHSGAFISFQPTRADRKNGCCTVILASLKELLIGTSRPRMCGHRHLSCHGHQKRLYAPEEVDGQGGVADCGEAATSGAPRVPFGGEVVQIVRGA